MFLRSKIQDTMLRKRSRAVSSSKQGLMSETPSIASPTAASLFTSPSLFAVESQSPRSGAKDPEAAVSPTSILETKPFSAVRNPFFLDKLSPTSTTPTASSEIKHTPPETGDPRATGLGLLDALPNEESFRSPSMQEQRTVVFGSQLKIQILPPHSSQSFSAPPTGSPVEFGIRNRSSQLALHSPARRSHVGAASMGYDLPASSPQVFAGCLPQPAMELSEEYTCVILHGPNPKTTHIFDHCIIESCGDGFANPINENRSSDDHLGYAADDFLSSCYGCKKKLGPGEDVYIYRGEKAFCSQECRYQEMLFDEGKEKF